MCYISSTSTYRLKPVISLHILLHVSLAQKQLPAYIPKDIVHTLLCLQQLIDNDPEVSPYLKVVMVENYNVTYAESIIPAADFSEQISLASKEASGTSNMKFMLNSCSHGIRY